MSSEPRGISIDFTPSFVRELKRLAKRYRSIQADVDRLVASLGDNPMQGTDLGMGCRKVRMAISSKDKGKSGGARVITLTVLVASEGVLKLLTIYDKSDRASIGKMELARLLAEAGMA